ncbi:DUF4845 domain-containing protein [Methylococcus sp. EFPC2]|uniref:DUF4845 domain-containing protein n=1 Tax=Methylococcus sp. EFPC2 TaxID=2812648 RepID=UPI00196722AE|nr:DUF4845 domain-containing protein [Methylococcus sp. EFPC2]QSA98341.1 DUF4845 domain-containing protein [Methylococcus sp. EFPC2]
MYSQPGRQSGMTLIGFLLMFLLIGFFALLTLKLVPIYLEHFKISSSLESLKKEPDIGAKSKNDVLRLLERRWEINMVNAVTAKDVVYTRQPGKVKIQIAYEVTTPILGNVDALVYFDDVIEVPSN